MQLKTTPFQFFVLFLATIRMASNCTTTHCASCVIGTCYSCSIGYFIKALEQLCPQCPTGCSVCTSDTNCSSCITKYYLSSNFCYACPNECATCTSSSVCGTCISGYYLQSSQCPQCPTGCAACTSSTNCSSCRPNYYLSSNQCLPCPTICSACTSPSVCSNCIDGYYLSGNYCFACQTPCSKCVNSSIQCTQCVPNYGLVGTTCQLCTKPCTNCENSITNCIACLDSANQSAPSCDCTSPAKYLNLNTYMCEDCINPCLSCSSDSQCDSCIFTYLLIGTVCIPCTKPCSNCNGSITTCSTCIDVNQSPPSCQCNTGYIMDNNTYMCIQCTYPCATCQTSVSYCLTCAPTYTYNSSTHTCNCLSTQYEDDNLPNQCQNCSSACQTCSLLDSNCISCDSNLKRQLDNNQCICEDGYYDSGTCQQCTLPCVTCISVNDCQSCYDHVQILPNCQCPDQYFMDASSNCQNCLIPCFNCKTSQSTCTSCISNYYLSGNMCLQCSLPCLECFDSNTKCSICTDANQYIVNDNCVCKDGYYMDAAFKCQLCTHPCLTCLEVPDKCQTCALTFEPAINSPNQCQCPQGYYEELTFNPSKCQKCQAPCGNCVDSPTNCISCLNLNMNVKGNACDCDQGYKFDADFQCIFEKCVEPCLTCNIPTFCLSCIKGYFLENDGQCQECGNDCKICNDQQICEFCNDGYFNQNNNCIKCNDNCQTCIDDQNNCLSCNVNELLIENKCYCDTNTLNDTCIQCQYPCLVCDNNQQCQQCATINGLYLNNENQCICQDNYIWQDNKCQQICTLNCQQCQKDLCLECQDQYNLINGKCQLIQPCGNGQIDNQEQCDDGNTNSNDGCYQCKIEQNWNCNIEQPNQCTYFEAPNLILTYLNQTQSIQYVQLQFSQEIKVIQNLSYNMDIIVEGIALENYNITIYSIKEASDNLSFAQYQIGVEIYEQPIEKPKLSIKLHFDVFNEYEVKLQNSKGEIQLKIPKYLNPEQKQKAESASDANENIIFGLGAISALSLFMGETAIFQEILRLLQYQSYLKYINLDYPQNVEIFFKSTNIVSVSSIIKYTNLNYYMTKYSLKQGPLQTDGKFAYYQYDADLITNLACQIIQLIGLVLIGFVSNTIQRKFYDKQNIIKYMDWMKNFADKHKKPIIFDFFKSLYSMIQSVFQGATNFTRQGLRGLFLINSQDLIFKAFIYLHYMQFNTIRNYIQAIIALSIIGSYLVFIFLSLSRNSFIFRVNKTNQLQMQYDVVTLARQTAFLGLLVYFQSNEILQTILMSFTNIIYFIVLKRKKRMTGLFHKVQQIIELIVILFTLSTFFYYKDLEFFSETFKIQVGWAQIGILLMSLVAEALKFIIAKTKGLVKYIQDKLNESKKKKDPMEQFHVIPM